MGGFLRQSTASQSRALGPFLDPADYSAETGLTIANTDIKLVVNGGASANKNSGGGTHRVNGVYGVTFDATDTATVGEMEVSVFMSGALPVFDKFVVLEEAVYDMLFASSALGYVNNAPVNVAQFGGSNGTFSSGVPTVNINTTNRPGIRKNTALTNFEILMTDDTDHNPATGKTVTVTRSVDGGAFGSGTLGSVSEVSDGIYKFDFGAGDLNGDVITLKASATGCDDTFITIKTSP